MDGSEERGGVFGVAGSNATPALEFQESVFDKVAQFVEILVIGSLLFAVLFGRNDRLHVLAFGLIHDGIAVIALVGQQIIGLNSLNQALSLCAISCGTLSNNDSDRHTRRIHGQMYLGVEPPFVRLMS